MRIVKYGHIKPKVVKCNYCGAILEYVPRDIQVHRYYCLECPVCKKYIYKDSYGNDFTKYDLYGIKQES